MQISKCEIIWDALRLANNYRNAINYRKQKYSSYSDKKQIENTKGLTKGQKLPEKTPKNSKKIINKLSI